MWGKRIANAKLNSSRVSVWVNWNGLSEIPRISMQVDRHMAMACATTSPTYLNGIQIPRDAYSGVDNRKYLNVKTSNHHHAMTRLLTRGHSLSIEHLTVEGNISDAHIQQRVTVWRTTNSGFASKYCDSGIKNRNEESKYTSIRKDYISLRAVFQRSQTRVQGSQVISPQDRWVSSHDFVRWWSRRVSETSVLSIQSSQHN